MLCHLEAYIRRAVMIVANRRLKLSQSPMMETEAVLEEISTCAYIAKSIE